MVFLDQFCGILLLCLLINHYTNSPQKTRLHWVPYWEDQWRKGATMFFVKICANSIIVSDNSFPSNIAFYYRLPAVRPNWPLASTSLLETLYTPNCPLYTLHPIYFIQLFTLHPNLYILYSCWLYTFQHTQYTVYS